MLVSSCADCNLVTRFFASASCASGISLWAFASLLWAAARELLRATTVCMAAETASLELVVVDVTIPAVFVVEGVAELAAALVLDGAEAAMVLALVARAERAASSSRLAASREAAAS